MISLLTFNYLVVRELQLGCLIAPIMLSSSKRYYALLIVIFVSVGKEYRLVSDERASDLVTGWINEHRWLLVAAIKESRF